MEAACLELSPNDEPFALRQALTDSKVEAAAYADSLRLAGYLESGKLTATHWQHGTVFNPFLKNDSARDGRWIFSESEREKALELLGLLVIEELAGRTVAVKQSPHAQKREAERNAQRKTKMGYYLDEAAQEIADQQGEEVSWARSFHKHMLKAAALPAGDPNRLKVRHTDTGVINPDGTKFSHIALVRHTDMNEWLQASGETYSWFLKSNEVQRDEVPDVVDIAVTAEVHPLQPQSQVTDPPVNHNGNNKKWTDEKLEELRAYRANHKMSETSAHFGISEQRIREIDPRPKQKITGYNAFTHRPK